MSGKTSRTKGHSFERKVAKDMQEIGFPKARRQLEYHADDANGIDIQNTGRFKIQCKAMKKQPNVPEVMKNIQTKRDDIPVVVYKVDRKGTYVAFKYEDALSLMRVLKEA